MRRQLLGIPRYGMNWLLAASVIATLGVRVAVAQTDPVIDARGHQTNRDYFSQQPFENIDTLSGSLVLSFTDLVLPGNAGRDLRFTRTYNSKVNDVASGWTFGLGGMVMNVVSGPCRRRDDAAVPDEDLPRKQPRTRSGRYE